MVLTVKDGQTLLDVAIQEFGSWEAAIAIAHENNMSLTDVPTAGTLLNMPDGTWNRTMQRWCKDNDVSPATARDESGIRMNIFTEQFTEEFQ